MPLFSLSEFPSVAFSVYLLTLLIFLDQDHVKSLIPTISEFPVVEMPPPER